MGVFLGALLHAVKNPLDVFRKRQIGETRLIHMKNILPDARNGRDYEVVFVGEIVIEGANCHMTRLRDGAHVQRG